MSLDNSESIDAIGIDKVSGDVILSIVDHWDWGEEERHLRALQEKINSYFGFVEEGQIYTSYPDAKGRMLCIDIILKYQPTNNAVNFLKKASEVAKQLDIKITHRLHSS